MRSRRRLFGAGGGWQLPISTNLPDDEPPARAWNVPGWSRPPDDNPELGDVKLMAEYGVELPLWGREWWLLHLPAELLDDLADWQAEFQRYWDPENGWSSDEVAVRWAGRGDELAAQLRRSLPSDIRLSVDMWPTRKRGPFARLVARFRR